MWIQLSSIKILDEQTKGLKLEKSERNYYFRDKPTGAGKRYWETKTIIEVKTALVK